MEGRARRSWPRLPRPDFRFLPPNEEGSFARAEQAGSAWHGLPDTRSRNRAQHTVRSALVNGIAPTAAGAAAGQPDGRAGRVYAARRQLETAIALFFEDGDTPQRTPGRAWSRDAAALRGGGAYSRRMPTQQR